MHKGIKKILKGILLSFAVVLVLSIPLFFAVFSTKWGFNTFIQPLQRTIAESNRCEDRRHHMGTFSHETYRRDEFCQKYFSQKCQDTDELIKLLNEQYPANWTRNKFFLYNHNHRTAEVIETDKETKEKKYLNKLFGVNKLTDFVYVTNHWTYISETP